MILRPKSRAEEIALFRSELVGALVRRDLSRGELKRELEALSLVRFRVPAAPARGATRWPRCSAGTTPIGPVDYLPCTRSRARTAAMVARCQ
jgi:hypothetical protein